MGLGAGLYGEGGAVTWEEGGADCTAQLTVMLFASATPPATFSSPTTQPHTTPRRSPTPITLKPDPLPYYPHPTPDPHPTPPLQALVALDSGELTEALSLAQKGLEIRQKTLASDHPDLAQSLACECGAAAGFWRRGSGPL